LQSIRFNSNIYYRFPINYNMSTHNGCYPLHYIVTTLIWVGLSITLHYINNITIN